MHPEDVTNVPPINLTADAAPPKRTFVKRYDADKLRWLKAHIDFLLEKNIMKYRQVGGLARL